MISRSTVVTAVAALSVVALLVVGCDSAGSGGGGDSSSTPDQSVSEAELNQSAGSTDFADIDLDFSGDKAEAAAAAFSGVASVGSFMGEWFENAPEDWEPSNGDVTLNPSDPAQFETAQDMYISAGFSGEAFFSDSGDYSGKTEGGATVDVDATQTPGDYGPETLDVEGEITADLSVTEGIVSQTDLPDVPGGAIHAAFNLDGTGDPTYDADGGLKALVLDYATSARLSAAVSVEGAPVGDGQTENGHFLITLSYDDNVELDITESLLGDESALADYLESKISTDFTLIIDVYDAGGDSVEETYTYTADELEAIFQ